jgi:voltage-gated potassium channel Kch
LILSARNSTRFARDRQIWRSVWWATVTLFTIGYGDKVSSRFFSRIVTMMWMFVGVGSCG